MYEHYRALHQSERTRLSIENSVEEVAPLVAL